MKQLMKKGITGLILLCIILVCYTIWDNHRFIMVEQEIKIDDLPEEFEGFTILQISDLHEKVFGTGQEKLIQAVNTIDYDAIIFTGDMQNGSTHYGPFYSLIEGIENKKHALYIKGNADPENYQSDMQKPFVKSEFIKGMERRGVQLLESNYTIKRGSEGIHFIDFELSAKADIEGQIDMLNNRSIPKNAVYRDHLNALFDHQTKLLKDISFLDKADQSEVFIALNHYPVVDKRIDQLNSTPGSVFRPFDLIVAGHYHGGQIRLPFLGALFVPEAWYERNGFLPPQDRVKGLWTYKGTRQYVSAGLGSSDFVPFLNFRFLNPPEINVLTLTGKHRE
ncbi:metallophosphoesterase [Domibacillus sp. PGB-M46]|uniref:metallophosphoesterase n=1 Tax=Domibacillus sp. PGB-M46 TaxID=2910255 RepID=UPI001F56EC0C|nr:metallophosphoesterase [Domibacillus sp. PGB-M46]MCI2255176.1 metallophosphoesterase [Domibacillus sp. PGB-M46]